MTQSGQSVRTLPPCARATVYTPFPWEYLLSTFSRTALRGEIDKEEFEEAQILNA